MQVKEGDVIDVDTAIQPKDDQKPEKVFKRGRVVVKEIEGETKKGRWRVTLHRHKQFSIVRKPLEF